SRNPLVVKRPTRAPSRVRMVLVATVVPCTNRVMFSALPLSPSSCSNTPLIPVITASSGAEGVEGTFHTDKVPSSRRLTMPVRLLPVATAPCSPVGFLLFSECLSVHLLLDCTP